MKRKWDSEKKIVLGGFLGSNLKLVRMNKFTDSAMFSVLTLYLFGLLSVAGSLLAYHFDSFIRA